MSLVQVAVTRTSSTSSINQRASGRSGRGTRRGSRRGSHLFILHLSFELVETDPQRPITSEPLLKAADGDTHAAVVDASGRSPKFPQRRSRPIASQQHHPITPPISMPVPERLPPFPGHLLCRRDDLLKGRAPRQMAQRRLLAVVALDAVCQSFQKLSRACRPD
jgi:hypothetical protein